MATAEWKKVIVSGSQADLAAVTASIAIKVGSNQQIGATQATTFLTGSFTGSFKGDGTNLSGVTATFPGSNLTTLLSATRIFSNDGVSNTNNTYVTAGQIMTGSYAGVSGDITINTAGVATIQPNSVALGTDTTGDYVATIAAGTHISSTGGATGEAQAHNLSVNTGTLTPVIWAASASYSGSLYTGVTGDITITAAGLATIAANSVALGSDTTGDYVATLGSGTGVTIGSNTGEGSTPTIAVNYGSTANTAVQGSTTISLTGTANEVEITGTTAQALGGGPSYIIGLPNNVTIGNNLTVTGDLTVNGTTTVIDTTNLSVEDRFIVLNHGSGSIAPTAEGGIIVEGNATPGTGSAFYYDGDTVQRWGVALGVLDTATSVTANSYVVTVSGSGANPANNPIYGGTNGYGNMYVNTNDNTIWIFA